MAHASSRVRVPWNDGMTAPRPSRMTRVRYESGRVACQVVFVKSGTSGMSQTPRPSTPWQRMQYRLKRFMTTLLSCSGLRIQYHAPPVSMLEMSPGPGGRKTPFAPSLSVTILSSEVSQISTFPKFMEELIMPFKRAQVPSQREILSLAEDWGKVVARRAFGDEGPDLDLNFDAIEAVAFQAAQAVIKGTIQQSLSQQMRKLGETQSCPQCRRVCPVETEPRELIVRGATVQYDEPKCHCPTCRRDFFPSPSRVAT